MSIPFLGQMCKLQRQPKSLQYLDLDRQRHQCSPPSPLPSGARFRWRARWPGRPFQHVYRRQVKQSPSTMGRSLPRVCFLGCRSVESNQRRPRACLSELCKWKVPRHRLQFEGRQGPRHLGHRRPPRTSFQLFLLLERSGKSQKNL